MSAGPDGLLIEEWLFRQAGALWPRAEAMFGPAAMDGWELAGVTFVKGGPIVAHVPELGQSLLIILSPKAKEDRDEALFQFSHELAHCLYPMQGRQPPMIEEGCCVKFSLEAPIYSEPGYAKNAYQNMISNPAASNYVIAHMTVQDLLAIDPDAIRKLRAREPNWNNITPLMILDVVPSFPPGYAILLCDVRDMHDTAWVKPPDQEPDT